MKISNCGHTLQTTKEYTIQLFYKIYITNQHTEQRTTRILASLATSNIVKHQRMAHKLFHVNAPWVGILIHPPIADN